MILGDNPLKKVHALLSDLLRPGLRWWIENGMVAPQSLMILQYVPSSLCRIRLLLSSP